MTIELPVLRLGLAGFSAAQQQQIREALPELAPGGAVWELCGLTDADAWWVSGTQARLLPGATIKVAPADPAGRALRLHLPDIDRPVAFSLPLVCEELASAHSFDANSNTSTSAMLEKFETWLSPLTAQYCLAAHIVEQESAVGRGVFDVGFDGRLLAVVDMRGDVGVLPGTGPAEFDNAQWRPRESPSMPSQMTCTSMSQLMWQYCVRTQRDLLPRHYRTQLLYFRRAPRLPHRLLADSHLLLMRELAAGPARFEALQRRTSLHPRQLARDLAALYFVGTVTANPKRAAPSQRPHLLEEVDSGPHSSVPPDLDSVPADAMQAAAAAACDLTAPAPIGQR